MKWKMSICYEPEREQLVLPFSSFLSFLSISCLSFPSSVLPFSPPHQLCCSYLCLGDIIAAGQMLSDGLTDWYGHRYTGSDMHSRPCRLGDRETCSSKISEMRERGNPTHGRTRQLADLTSWSTLRQKRSRQCGSGYQEVRHLRHGAETLTRSDLQQV